LLFCSLKFPIECKFSRKNVISINYHIDKSFGIQNIMNNHQFSGKIFNIQSLARWTNFKAYKVFLFRFSCLRFIPKYARNLNTIWTTIKNIILLAYKFYNNNIAITRSNVFSDNDETQIKQVSTGNKRMKLMFCFHCNMHNKQTCLTQSHNLLLYIPQVLTIIRNMKWSLIILSLFHESLILKHWVVIIYLQTISPEYKPEI
jgi:hypothetical protein